MPPHRLRGVRLDALIRGAREPFFLLGPGQKLIAANRAWEELTGVEFAAVAGMVCPPHGPTRPDDPAGLAASFCPPPEAVAGRAASTTTLILAASGERLRRRVEFWPIHDASGELTGILGSVRPIDASPAAPESQAHRLRAELMELRDRLHRRHKIEALVGRGPVHQRLLDQVAAAAASAVPVLIVGEGGTGKRLVAQTIHHQSPRRQAPLLGFDCRALPPEVLERELFGTPSEPPEPGFAVPDGSTVLVGDILDLPRDLQAPLAGRLDGRARLIATTAGDPDAALAAGRLRPDLYYALTTLVLRLAPLRDRRDELPVLAQHFLERANLRGERHRAGFRPEAVAALAAHDWPGNLRELARVVEEAHGRGTDPLIGPDDIPAAIRGQRGGAYLPPAAPPPPTLKELLVQVERRAIERALTRGRQNKTRAARILGVNRPFLYRRIKELGIPDRPESPDPGDDGDT